MRTPRFLVAPVLLLSLAGSYAGESSYTFLQGGLDSTVEAGIGVPLNDQFSLRASLGHTQPGDHTKHVNASPDFRAHPDASNTVSLIADWFPVSGSGLRLSAGARYGSGNGENLVGLSGAQGVYTLSGHTYSLTEAGSLNGRVQYNKLEPYLGVGWESAPANKPGWRFIGDVGVNLQTGAKVSLSSSAGAGDTTLQQDIAAARQQLARDCGGTHWRLGATIGVAYSF